MATQSLTREQALKTLSTYLGDHVPKRIDPPDIIEWGQANYFVPAFEPGFPGHLIQFQPHQSVILRFAFNRELNWRTIIYSCVKKGGKTEIAALIGRYIAETFGRYREVYLLANDYEQAKGRLYDAIVRSIEMTPGYDKPKRELSGRWQIVDRELRHIPSGSKIKALSSDYKGAAGGQPDATLYSELWGYESEDARRLFNEMTIIPTKPYSKRIIETYAGFEGESDLLQELWELATVAGRRVTNDELVKYAGAPWPYEGNIPLYVNEAARLFAYIDTGVEARRMPWQTESYYASEAATLDPSAFRRFHLNEWVSPVDEFIPLIWWEACRNSDLANSIPSDMPVVLAADASVSSDCTALQVCTRSPFNHEHIAARKTYIWTPPQGGTMDYTTTLDPAIRDLCAHLNVVELTYDAYQLHHLMTELKHDEVCNVRAFSQMKDRNIADYDLYCRIRDHKIVHNDQDNAITSHLAGCARKIAKDEDTKLRIVKRNNKAKIDGVIALSMGSAECARLLL